MMLSSVLIVFLQLCSLQLIVDSRPTCRLQGDLVKSAHDQLRDLGGEFPIHCLPYNANISFPSSALTPAANHLQCGRVLSMVNESLWEAGQMFDDPDATFPTTWDEDKLDLFLSLQDRIMRGASCLSSGSSVLTPYFQSVAAVVKQQESSDCGWMALRRDLLLFLKSILQTHHSCFTWRSASNKRL
ncbi:interferon phi 3 [Cheilinus undulatus]|uniref:interferon phi 3 n=1 Tax=Cheilinus undulatus TaxID=241271 RepID=UPI001BD62370|nr:interferon phi 3 [Cheilinus undulatus]